MLQAAGTIFYSLNTNRILMNYRSSSVKNPHTWGFWGGKVEDNEKILEALSRELREEMGFIPEYIKVIPIDVFRTKDDKFRYFSFVVFVEEEFLPSINGESGGFGWFNIDHLPKPLHSGAFAVLKDDNFTSFIESSLSNIR